MCDCLPTPTQSSKRFASDSLPPGWCCASNRARRHSLIGSDAGTGALDAMRTAPNALRSLLAMPTIFASSSLPLRMNVRTTLVRNQRCVRARMNRSTSMAQSDHEDPARSESGTHMFERDPSGPEALYLHDAGCTRLARRDRHRTHLRLAYPTAAARWTGSRQEMENTSREKSSHASSRRPARKRNTGTRSRA